MTDKDETPGEVAEEVAETVTEPVAEVVPEPVKKETVDNPTPEIPAWGRELQEKVGAIHDKIMGSGEEEPPPSDGEMVGDDDAPVRKPWTHRGFGGKKG